MQSRYYDPSIGRFINADAFASTGERFIGYNMFTYCLNNPVALVDVSGYFSTDEQRTEQIASKRPGVKVASENSNSNIIEEILDAMSTPSRNGGTFSVGYIVGGTSYGASGGHSGCVSVDTGHNYALQSTESISPPTGFGGSIGLVMTMTDATYVTDLEGESQSAGFTIVNAFGISIDLISFVPSSNPNITNHGVAVTLGLGSEAGIQMAENITTPHGDVWNPIKNLKEKLFGGQ